MKRFFILTLILVFTISLKAQDTTSVEKPWNFSGMTSLNFSQVSLTNWSQGGESSVALNALSVINAAYTYEKTSWTNTLDLGYGVQRIGEEDPKKIDDHMEFLSKYGREAASNWFISGMLNFKTQFSKGYKESDAGDILISDFLSPGYLILSLGMEYKPGDKFFAVFSPLSGKITVVMNDSLSAAGRFGVDPGKNTRSEFGGSIKIGLNAEIMKNVTLTSGLDFFSNYVENPQNIDVSWKVLINMKVNEFLSANLSTHLLYDDDINYIDSEGIVQGPRVQFKELLGIGLSITF